MGPQPQIKCFLLILLILLSHFILHPFSILLAQDENDPQRTPSRKKPRVENSVEPTPSKITPQRFSFHRPSIRSQSQNGVEEDLSTQGSLAAISAESCVRSAAIFNLDSSLAIHAQVKTILENLGTKVIEHGQLHFTKLLNREKISEQNDIDYLNALRFLRCQENREAPLSSQSHFTHEKILSWLKMAHTLANNQIKSSTMEKCAVENFHYENNNLGRVERHYDASTEVTTRPDGIHHGSGDNNPIYFLEHKNLQPNTTLYLTQQIQTQLASVHKGQGHLRIVITSEFDPATIPMNQWPKPSAPLSETNAKIYFVNKNESDDDNTAPLYRWNKAEKIWEKVEDDIFGKK